MTSLRGLVMVMMVAALLPPFTSSFWVSVSHFVDYVMVKNCFGEDMAMELEKTGMALGKQCWDKEWNSVHGFPSDMEIEDKDTQTGRVKRNIFKMPSSPTTSLQLCNLKAWKLLTPEYEMNYPIVEDFLGSGRLAEPLSRQLLQLSKSCRAIPVPPVPLMPNGEQDPTLKGLAAVKIYMDCMNSNGMKICMAREQKKLMEMVKAGGDQ